MGLFGEGGSAASPWIATGLAAENKNLPFICIGLILIAGSLLSLMLPETRDTCIDDIEREKLLGQEN